MELIEKLFKLKEANTTLRRELMAGLTGFITVAYVLFVVPAMLADAGMPRADATVAVIWVTAFACLVMGFYANFPVIVAPGLGIVAFFSYYVCGPMGLSWQAGLAAVFISGVIFLLLTVFKIRELIIRAVPLDLKYAIVVGLGCFIAFIGMKNAGVIVADPATFVGFGNMRTAEPLLACLGVIIISALMARNVRGAMMIGIVIVTVLGIALGVTPLPDMSQLSTIKLLPTATFMQLDFAAIFSYGIVTIVFTLTMVDLFDNMGTLIGLSQRAGLLNMKTGHVSGLNKALLSDSVATMSAAVVGTPTATSYVESAAAIAEGGRTGIVPIVTAVLFLACLFLLPLVNIVPAYATASALIVVGALMMQSVRHIHFDDFTICLPAFLTILTMPLTFNVATGFGLGFISYIVLSLITGKAHRLDLVGMLIAVAFAVNFCMR
jgi:AGZA family xanthine/uracil permease-like MFS transporter